MSSSSEEEGSFYDAPGDGGADERMHDAAGQRAADESGPADTRSQKNPSPPTPSSEHLNATRQRARSSTDSRRASAQYRYSLPVPIPAVPAIPAHLLATGKPATLIQRRKGGENARKESPDRLSVASSPVLHIQRPSTSGEQGLRTPSLRSPNPLSPRIKHDITNKQAPPLDDLRARRKSLSALSVRNHAATLDRLESGSDAGSGGKMNRFGKGKREDLFLELANDEVSAEERPPSRSERASSRLSSFANKRRSLPAQVGSSSPADLRPKTSGAIFGQRPLSRLGAENQGSELHRHVERYRNAPSRASFLADDASSFSTRSRSRVPHRYSEHPTTSPPQVQNEPRSPELPSFGRRRPSLTATSSHRARPSNTSTKYQDAYSETPADDSDRKQSLPESSAESEADDTVWDELDDLKSRIKKLELTGKLPPTSGAAGSNESSDRPRTATTAPTTIDSSPKHAKPEKKPETDKVAEAEPEDEAPTANGPSITNIHPNLHAALAKAKPLLNGSLYRTLEATATDALQLAAITGSAGPQGTAYTAAAIINGMTVSDRYVRRKADTMCRNLTDLCLALCEGKHEGPSIMSSPITLGTPSQQSPSIRLPRNSLDPNAGLNRSAGRPMSRLEARRTSILGSQAGSSLGNSPAISGGEELSASEQESTPSNIRTTSLRRLDRTGSRLQTSRLQRYGEAADDEDPTLRPASRAFTDAGRAKPLGPRDYVNNGTPPQRSPSLRDSLVARRTSANAAAFEGNRELMRVVSLNSDSGSRRRFHDPATPPVLEEEGGAEEYQPTPPSSTYSAQSKRRIMSLGNYGSRRTAGDVPSRTSSLNRRHVVVE
jgi:hypothetical protein